jgi:hypothetical protein
MNVKIFRIVPDQLKVFRNASSDFTTSFNAATPKKGRGSVFECLHPRYKTSETTVV